MRIIMSKRRSELIGIIMPYVHPASDDERIKLDDNAPSEVKKAFDEYMNLPPESEPEVY